MRKQKFIDAVIKAGWSATEDAQYENIEKLWEYLFPVAAEMEKYLVDMVESAHMSGQMSAGVDPSYSEAKAHAIKVIG